MSKDLDVSPLGYRIQSFMVDGKAHFIVQRRETLEPSVSLSVYEQYLACKFTSPNSIRSILKNVLYLFSWALAEGIDIEQHLLTGKLFDPIKIRRFAHWLSCRGTIRSGVVTPFSVSSTNAVLMHCSSMVRWFAKHYGFKGRETAWERSIALDLQRELFADHKKKDRRYKVAPDLTEAEIKAIENFLKPSNRMGASREVAMRDYLIWRLAIEFGLRQGEILALRLSDCPHQGQDFIDIVRIEERGKKYRDPRGANAPRPKTLSRHLGFLLANSPIPIVMNNYTTQYRCKSVNRGGRIVKQFILDHDFLFVSHHNKRAAPLTRSGMQAIAAVIAKGTGFEFHWHLTRHAFFNRAYSAIADIEDKETRKVKQMDLVTWGGWSDENSLLLYINRARQLRAEKALMFWQNGGNAWGALI